MKNKVIYTAVFGKGHGLIPQPKMKDFDYICFTDNPHLNAKPWICKVVEPPMSLDNTRKNRYYKILPHKCLSSYDISIYIDANFLIINDLNTVIQKYLKDFNMACFDHNQTTADPRDCIYDEYDAILDLAKDSQYKDDPQIMSEQIKMFKSEGFPQHDGLIKGGFLVRRHHEPEVITAMEDWWNIILNYSKRDQLSFNYIAWKNNFRFKIIPGDIRRGNPYIYFLGNHRQNWTIKRMKFKAKKIIDRLISS